MPSAFAVVFAVQVLLLCNDIRLTPSGIVLRTGISANTTPLKPQSLITLLHQQKYHSAFTQNITFHSFITFLVSTGLPKGQSRRGWFGYSVAVAVTVAAFSTGVIRGSRESASQRKHLTEATVV